MIEDASIVLWIGAVRKQKDFSKYRVRGRRTTRGTGPSSSLCSSSVDAALSASLTSSERRPALLAGELASNAKPSRLASELASELAWLHAYYAGASAALQMR